MADWDITLWIDEHRAAAMDEVLGGQGTSLERHMHDQLIALYREIVPTSRQAEIEAAIRQERETGIRRAEDARVVSALHITEGGADEYFKTDCGYDLLGVANRVRLYLRREPGTLPGSFVSQFVKAQAISPAEFDELAGVRMENSGKVAGIFEIDFDRQEFSAVHIMDGWKTFRLKDVSTAAYYAGKGEHFTDDYRLQVLLEKINGKELPSATRLTEKDIRFSDEILELYGKLNFYLCTDFNVDAVFGTHVETAENGDWLNVYANYDVAADEVCGKLEIELHREDGSDGELSYSLNPAEKELLRRKMDEYCQQQTGQTLETYRAQLLAEEQGLSMELMM